MLDAVAKAATRWASYPAQLIYNMAIGAYSSWSTGQYMNLNHNTTIDQIIARYNGTNPKFMQQYSQGELVDMFGGLIDGPYTASGIWVAGNEFGASYNTVRTPVPPSANLLAVIDRIEQLMKQIKSLEGLGYGHFEVQFILGQPRMVPLN